MRCGWGILRVGGDAMKTILLALSAIFFASILSAGEKQVDLHDAWVKSSTARQCVKECVLPNIADPKAIANAIGSWGNSDALKEEIGAKTLRLDLIEPHVVSCLEKVRASAEAKGDDWSKKANITKKVVVSCKWCNNGKDDSGKVCSHCNGTKKVEIEKEFINQATVEKGDAAKDVATSIEIQLAVYVSACLQNKRPGLNIVSDKALAAIKGVDLDGKAELVKEISALGAKRAENEKAAKAQQ